TSIKNFLTNLERVIEMKAHKIVFYIISLLVTFRVSGNEAEIKKIHYVSLPGVSVVNESDVEELQVSLYSDSCLSFYTSRFDARRGELSRNGKFYPCQTISIKKNQAYVFLSSALPEASTISKQVWLEIKKENRQKDKNFICKSKGVLFENALLFAASVWSLWDNTPVVSLDSLKSYTVKIKPSFQEDVAVKKVNLVANRFNLIQKYLFPSKYSSFDCHIQENNQ
ncbi:MAG: hypothetical protein K2X39_03035, partial [Silvanigrellaceae bacterium]|nr:hypothetical protein [Silvanigrellaceae bacterium]